MSATAVDLGPLGSGGEEGPDAALRAAREAVVAEHIRAEMAGDLDAVLATFPGGATYSVVPLGQDHNGDDAVRDLLTGLMTAFPDLTLRPLRVFHATDAVIVEGRMSGQQQADWGGITARGRTMDLPAALIFRFDGERLTNETVYYDHLSAVAQLSEPQAAEPPVADASMAG